MPRAPHPDKALLTAWLLLLLDGGESYGWALFGELRDRGVRVEASFAYRALRELERDDAVTSQWTHSDAGPQRRSYRLTAQGRQTFAEAAARVHASWTQHDRFVQAYERARDTEAQAGGHDLVQDAGAAPDDPPTAGLGRMLIAAWLLLLLERNASYGYGLRRALSDHDVRPDPPALYRVLRKLEDAGWVQSRWMRSAGGPRRRFYRIRAKGRRNLDELAAMIIAVRDSEGAFLRARAEIAP